jgi:hypothetical protein
MANWIQGDAGNTLLCAMAQLATLMHYYAARIIIIIAYLDNGRRVNTVCAAGAGTGPI